MLEFSMVNVSRKMPTARRAVATAKILLSPETLHMIRTGTTPKGGVLAAAEFAGVQASKSASQLIPLCHPLQTRYTSVKFDWEPDGIRIQASVEVIEPTGPEMEALTACAIAALTIYDMCKGSDHAMSIQELRLVEKSGGKSDDPSTQELSEIAAALIILSDRAHSGAYEDKSGPIAQRILEASGIQITLQKIIPDEPDQLRNLLISLADEKGIPLILTLGSTGLSPRDIAPDVTQSLVTREIPGIPEAFRIRHQSLHPTTAFLSRSVAGIRGESLIVNLPGRPSAIEENLAILIPALPHTFQMMNAGKHEVAVS